MTLDHLAGAAVLTARQIERTATGILALQRPDGAIPWFHGHKLDPWDHVEAAMALDAAGQHSAARSAYRWLAGAQNEDGSFHAEYADSPGGISEPVDLIKDANFTAYAAVGAYHHYVATGEPGILKELWPTVARAVDFVIGLQRPDGAIRWHPGSSEALLTGCSSMYLSLRCALAAAEVLGEGRPDWELAAVELGHALNAHPEAFTPKERYSMDWYYPVLGTALRGPAAHGRILAGWNRFVEPGYGVRCVADQPWVTGGESFELAIALWAIGRAGAARRVAAQASACLRDCDGMYWTGYVFTDKAVWPEEKTGWTAGSALLALAVLGGEPASSAVFGGALPEIPPVNCVAEGCIAAAR
ncbi:MAG TPA: prenyltransferase/squalene oxidase repeat-containing protein [Actinocrinis sp.]|jgi:hypothetical protein